MSTACLYYGQEEAVQHFIEQLREKFEISVSQMKSPGDELGNGALYIMPGRYASDMIKDFEDFYGQAKKQKVRSEELSSEEVAQYRSG